jgi:hypothetical protein
MSLTTVYTIRIAGTLDEATASWFEGLRVCQISDATTLLVTPAIDQTALHGILAILRDLAIPLIALCPREILSEDGAAPGYSGNGPAI